MEETRAQEQRAQKIEEMFAILEGHSYDFSISILKAVQDHIGLQSYLTKERSDEFL
jgi:hypothetical protein